MIKITHSGNLNASISYLKKISKLDRIIGILDKYGKEAVAALAQATPSRSGLTASSWSYEIRKTSSGYSIDLTNSNVNKGVPIAIILQYGHGTGTGGWVSGRDYINPAIQPIFERLANEAWKEVSNG